MKYGAKLSKDNAYRYSLTREWDDSIPAMVNFIMLNPSTADAHVDDPTIRRCIQFAKDWGYGSLIVTNLFAFRATHPELLHSVKDPRGKENDKYLIDAAARSTLHICAWGTQGRHEGPGVRALLTERGYDLHHLGLTQEGHPRHPLYLRSITKPQRWSTP